MGSSVSAPEAMEAEEEEEAEAAEKLEDNCGAAPVVAMVGGAADREGADS
jgi:hypothetical protein